MKKVFLIFILCLIIQFALISKWVAFGETLSDLDKDICSLGSENESLELQIASLVSVSAIEQRAILAGFTKNIATESEAVFSVAFKR